MNFIIARYFDINVLYKDPKNFRLLFVRTFCVTFQNIMFTMSQFYLPQSIIQTVNTTGFLFVFIVDYFINRVTINRRQFYGVMFGIIGVLLTVNG